MGRLAWERCPQFLPPLLPIAPPVCGRYHGTLRLGKVSPIFTPPPHSTACVWSLSWGTWVEKGVRNLHPPPPHSTACVLSLSWGTWVGKGVRNLHPPPHIAPNVCGRYHGAPGFGKVSPIFTPPSPSHRLCVAGIMGHLGLEMCPHFCPPPPFPIAPPLCDRYHGAPGLGKESPIFTTPPIAPPVCGWYHGAPGLVKVSPTSPLPHSTACVWLVTWGAWLGKFLPIFIPPPIAPPVLSVSLGTWVGKDVPNVHSPPPNSTACVRLVSWGAWLGKGVPEL